MKKNSTATTFSDKRLAGGQGMRAAKQPAEELLRRAVMANLLWEEVSYKDNNTKQIVDMVPLVAPNTVAQIAVEARFDQKLRHVPLFLAVQMCKYPEHKKLVSSLLATIVTRPDQATEFLSLYWANGKCPIANQAKKGLAAALSKFSEYQLAKYKQDDKEIKLRDVMFLVHPKPAKGSGHNTKEHRKIGVYDEGGQEFYRLANNELETPDTWEVALSSGADKKQAWTRLLKEGKLGALAFIRNLRNMTQAGVDRNVIIEGFNKVDTGWLLPVNFFAAAKHAPEFRDEIEKLMLRCLSNYSLDGDTIFVVDVSGSMGQPISSKSDFNRRDAAAAMAVMARHICQHSTLYVTAGNDGKGVHATKKVDKNLKGFALSDYISRTNDVGGGGIFTRQCLEHIKAETKEQPDRIIIFSDSQDCDRRNRVPAPFGKYNYIVDVSANTRGINYAGVWTAEVSGWSEHFLKYIVELEKGL